MTTALFSCDSCSRHIRLTERACPFCGATLSEWRIEHETAEPKERLSRAGAIAFAASIVLSGCREEPDHGSILQPYGVPITHFDASTPEVDASVMPDAGLQNTVMAPAYGAPAPDLPHPAPPASARRQR